MELFSAESAKGWKLAVHRFDESRNFSLLISRGCDAYGVARLAENCQCFKLL